MKTGGCRFAQLILTSIASGWLTSATTVIPAGTNDPKIILETLAQYLREWNNEPDPQKRVTIAKEILDASAPLIAGPMAPSKASSLGNFRKPAGKLSPEQRHYLGFWLVRARAAVAASNEEAGIEAAKVLVELEIGEPGRPDGLKAVAALNGKGWLNPPEPGEWQKVADAANAALRSGGGTNANEAIDVLNNAIAKADAFLKKYPRYEKAILLRGLLVDARDTVEAGSKTPAQEKPPEGGDELPGDIAEFLNGVLDHQTSNDPSQWAGDFAEMVDYGFKDNGLASRGWILNDRKKLIQKYPTREYSIVGDPSVDIVSDSEVTAEYSYRYSYDGTKHASGQSHVVFTAKLDDDNQWRITKFDDTAERD